MRIAILTQTSGPVGGLATYLQLVIPALAEHGHDIGFWHEFGPPPTADRLALPPGSPSWSVEALGVEEALSSLRAWRPDVLFAHGLSDPDLEARTLEIAPGVFVAHAYYGTCISGAKAFKFPTTKPCDRRFGWPCVANFYPRRCGGWSPITMVAGIPAPGVIGWHSCPVIEPSSLCRAICTRSTSVTGCTQH